MESGSPTYKNAAAATLSYYNYGHDAADRATTQTWWSQIGTTTYSGTRTYTYYQQRLLILDIWRRCGLPAGVFAPLVGLSRFTLYEWKRRFEADGPAGLADKPPWAHYFKSDDEVSNLPLHAHRLQV